MTFQDSQFLPPLQITVTRYAGCLTAPNGDDLEVHCRAKVIVGIRKMATLSRPIRALQSYDAIDHNLQQNIGSRGTKKPTTQNAPQDSRRRGG